MSNNYTADNPAFSNDPDCDDGGSINSAGPIKQGPVVRAENDVTQIQIWLFPQDPGQQDGVWGDDTTRAFRDRIQDVQKQNGLEATGKLDPVILDIIRQQSGPEVADSLGRLQEKGVTNYKLSEPDPEVCEIPEDGGIAGLNPADLLPPESVLDTDKIFPDVTSITGADTGTSPLPEGYAEDFIEENPAVAAEKSLYDGQLTVDQIYDDLRISAGLGGNSIGLDESTLRGPALEGLGTLIYGGNRDMAFADAMSDIRNGTGIAEGWSQEDRQTMLNALEPLEKHLGETNSSLSSDSDSPSIVVTGAEPPPYSINKDGTVSMTLEGKSSDGQPVSMTVVVETELDPNNISEEQLAIVAEMQHAAEQNFQRHQIPELTARELQGHPGSVVQDNVNDLVARVLESRGAEAGFGEVEPIDYSEQAKIEVMAAVTPTSDPSLVNNSTLSYS